MFNLVLKDVLIQKRTFIYSIIYGIFFILVFQSTIGAGGAYIAGSVALSYLLIMYAAAYDDKNNSYIVLNSFPIRRSQIVFAKYITIFVYTLLSAVILGLLGVIFKSINLGNIQRFIGVQDVLGIFISLTLLSSIYFPLYFKLGYIKAKAFNFLLLMAFVVLPAFLVNFLKSHVRTDSFLYLLQRLSNLPDWQVGLLIFALGIIILIISLTISLNIYRKRDF